MRLVVLVPDWLAEAHILGERIEALWRRWLPDADVVLEGPGDLYVDGRAVLFNIATPLREGSTVLVATSQDGPAIVVHPDPELIGTPELETARRVHPRTEGCRFLDRMITLQRVEVAMVEDLRKLHQLAGVRFVAGAQPVIGPDVALAPGAELWPGTVLLGTTRVGEGAVVGTGCQLRDTELSARSTLRPYTVAEGALLLEGASAGPFAHLRPGTVLEGSARVGNFVETKATVLGVGAKANHLSYLGNATIGAGANIGAGVITCNYDGAGKHPTDVGDGAFIGTNSSLIAPVRVGDGALVAAGSVITRNVEAGALSVARAPQVDTEGKGAALLERNRRRAEETQ